ncbi:MAG: CcmD family protein [Polyangiaceae bacterium]
MSDRDDPGAVPQTTDRATTFQAVQGGQEHHSGETLLVSAYAVLWVLVLAWVAFIWRKQGDLNARLFDLERVLDKAAAEKTAARKT